MFAERISQSVSGWSSLQLRICRFRERGWMAFAHTCALGHTHTHTHTCTNTIMKPSEPALLVASLVTQLVKNPPAMWETWIWSLGWEDSLVKGKATHSSILAWRIPVAKSQTRLSNFHFHFSEPARALPFLASLPLTASANTAASLLWTPLSGLDALHDRPVHAFMSHYPRFWRRG